RRTPGSRQLPLPDRQLATDGHQHPVCREITVFRTPRGWMLAALVVPALALAGCSSDNAVNKPSDTGSAAAGGGGGQGKYGYKIAVVTHGSSGDAFWSIVKAGAQKAGTDLGDTVTYESDG